MQAVSRRPLPGMPRSNGEPQYDQVPLYALGIFSVYIITWFMQLGGRISILGAIRFELLLAVMLIAIAFTLKRQAIEVKSGLAPYLAAFFVALIIQIPFSYNVEFSWTIFVDRVIKFAFMAVFIVHFVRSPTALRYFIMAFMLAWFKMGQEGFLGQITGSLVWENQGVMRLHGTTPLYEHPNSFSGFGLGILPFVYYLFPVANRWQKVFLLVMLVFSINIILFTGSRTGYVGFILFAAYVLLRSKHKFKFIAAAVVVVLIAVPLIPQQYIARFESITGQEAEGKSKVKRLEILQDAAIIFTEHPFGVGVSAFPTIREQRFGRTQDTHNLYMEVLTNLGIQGFIIWALMIAAIFRNIRRLLRETGEQLSQLAARGPPERDTPIAGHVRDLELMRAMLQAVAAYVVVRLAVGFFGMDLYEIYWWFSMGIVIAIHNMSQVAGQITRRHLGLEGVTEPARPSAARGRRAPAPSR